MHVPLVEQHRWFASILRGHYGYFGLPHNWRALNAARQNLLVIWFLPTATTPAGAATRMGSVQGNA